MKPESMQNRFLPWPTLCLSREQATESSLATAVVITCSSYSMSLNCSDPRSPASLPRLSKVSKLRVVLMARTTRAGAKTMASGTTVAKTARVEMASMKMACQEVQLLAFLLVSPLLPLVSSSISS